MVCLHILRNGGILYEREGGGHNTKKTKYQPYSEIHFLTERRGCQRVVMIHELPPGHHHHGARVVVKAFVGMHRSGHDPG